MTTVHEAWSAVMADVQAVGKTGRNTQQDYSFRGIDAVVNAVGPALRDHHVSIIPELLDSSYRDIEVGRNRTSMREVTVTVRYTVYGPDGDSFSGVTIGESMDSGDKGTAKAFSVAYRIFLLQALTIPTDDPDPDEHSYERSAAAPPAEWDPKIAADVADRWEHLPADNAQRLLHACEKRWGSPLESPVDLPGDWAPFVVAALEAEEAKADAS